MSKRPFIALIALLVILGLVIWAANRKSKNPAQEAATPLLSVYAYNQTKSLPANRTAASPNDVIVYTLSAENQTDQVVSGYIIEANVAQVTDKSTLIDATGAGYNSATNSLVWTPLDIPANGVIQKQFSVRVNSIPSGGSDTVMRIKFNNEMVVSIQSVSTGQRVAGANTSNSPYKAPVTGPAEDLGLWLAGIATVSFFGIKKYRTNKV
ncbi:MAG: hypothetical protein WDN47_00135 [Candidatus Doudnabacteria bacterium]